MNDGLFPWDAQQQLFAAFASSTKHLAAAPGAHLPPDATLLTLIHSFLRQHLGSGEMS